jgi:hypothetical protein
MENEKASLNRKCNTARHTLRSNDNQNKPIALHSKYIVNKKHSFRSFKINPYPQNVQNKQYFTTLVKSLFHHYSGHKERRPTVF